jgi:hypothetical protein
MSDASPARHDKFRAYRARKKAAGLREVRMWVPDVRLESVRAEIAQQAALLDHSDDARTVNAWADAMVAESLSNED